MFNWWTLDCTIHCPMDYLVVMISDTTDITKKKRVNNRYKKKVSTLYRTSRKSYKLEEDVTTRVTYEVW